MKGYNATIMAYGQATLSYKGHLSGQQACKSLVELPKSITCVQTGAGKTYTLSSVQSADNIGMMPRAAANIFAEIAADSSHVYNVVMGYVQIYMELIQVRDFSLLTLRQSKATTRHSVENGMRQGCPCRTC